MSNNDSNKKVEKNVDMTEAQKKEDWNNRNMPIIIGVGALGLIVLMVLLMRFCG